MLTTIYRATCDQCGDTRTLPNANGFVQASEQLRKVRWVILTDYYGNELHFCNDACREAFTDRCGIQWEEMR